MIQSSVTELTSNPGRSAGPTCMGRTTIPSGGRSIRSWSSTVRALIPTNRQYRTFFHHKANFFPRSVDQVTPLSTSSKLTLKAANLTRSRRSSRRTLRRTCPSANFKSRFTRARVTSDLTSLPSGGTPWRRRAYDPSGRSQTWCTSTLCAAHDRSWRRCVSFFF